jgi:hypothetical protein
MKMSNPTNIQEFVNLHRYIMNNLYSINIKLEYDSNNKARINNFSGFLCHYMNSYKLIHIHLLQTKNVKIKLSLYLTKNPR